MSLDSGGSSVVFVDLDGTLVLGNSFHEFLGALWRGGGLGVRVLMVQAFLLRCARGGSGRLAMKARLMKAFEGSSPERQDIIVGAVLGRLRRMISFPVLQRVRDLAEAGWIPVLATAAPDYYARPFTEELGFFRDCLATPPVAGVAWREFSGDAKADVCAKWLAASGGAERIAVITDHADDLPLLRQADHAVLQAWGESLQTIQAALRPGLRVEVIDPVAPQEGGGYWLWFDERLSGPHDEWELKTILSKHRYALIYSAPPGRWVRIGPGDPVTDATHRVYSPPPPSLTSRFAIAFHRALIRDALGIFH